MQPTPESLEKGIYLLKNLELMGYRRQTNGFNFINTVTILLYGNQSLFKTVQHNPATFRII